MKMSEHEAEELLRPLRKLPRIEARRSVGAPKRRGRRPVRLAVTIAVVGVLGAASAVAAVERFASEKHLTTVQEEQRLAREEQKLRRLTNASNSEIQAIVREHGNGIPPSMVHPAEIRRAARSEHARQYPDELRFYGRGHQLRDVTRCEWPHPNPDCLDLSAAIRRHPGTLVETWSDGRPIAGGG